MTPVCIFAYSGDAMFLPLAVRGAMITGCAVRVIDDAANPMPSHVVGWLDHVGVEYQMSIWPRRGNLNGTDCAAGICRALASAARDHGSEHAIKLDADTLMIRPDAFRGNTGCKSTTMERREAFGCCYSLDAVTADKCAQSLTALPLDPTAPEDVTIWRHVAASGDPFRLDEFCPSGGLFSGVPGNASPDGCERFAALTFGNRPPGGWHCRPLEIFRRMSRFLRYAETLAKRLPVW